MQTEKIELDRFDHAILNELASEARISVTELAKRIGLSKSPTQARLRRLEVAGIIKGYRAMLDPVQLGLNHVAFVEVRLHDTTEASLRAFNAAVSTIHEIEQCHLIAGSFDYLLKVRTSDITSYRQVLGEKISSLPCVAHTSTFVVMEAVKESILGDVS
ncbi:MAG: Lrp/AsnC ligand binding domain-containing protein [Pseudomonadota bacterium]|nr:Lrp/AsnC ligand binding domain-containing protein [Pseudomonadota bacterium]